MKFCSFLQRKDVKTREGFKYRFEESWTNAIKQQKASDMKIHCMLVDDIMDQYAKLGELGLRGTKADVAFCLGGGQVVLQEKELINKNSGSDDGVEFIPYDATRTKNNEIQHGALIAKADNR